MMNDDRAEILNILREQERPTVAPSPSAAAGLPGDAAAGDVVAMFIESARRNSAEVQLLDGEDAVPQAVAEFLRARQARLEIVCEEQLSALPWDAAGVSAAVRPPTSDDNCGATSILAAAADTGAMLMSDAQKHALTQSLLPPCHVAVLRAADIVPSMAALWRRLPRIMRLPRIYTALCGRRLPSPLPRCCVFVCGPSRTGDIEQTLVLGVHGPTAVLVLVIR